MNPARKKSDKLTLAYGIGRSGSLNKLKCHLPHPQDPLLTGNHRFQASRIHGFRYPSSAVKGVFDGGQ